MFQTASLDFHDTVLYISLSPVSATSAIHAVSSAATYFTLIWPSGSHGGRRILYSFLYTDSSRHTCIKPASSDEEEQARVGSEFQPHFPLLTSLFVRLRCDKTAFLLR